MNDEHVRRIAKGLGMPRVMLDTESFRAALGQFGEKAVAQALQEYGARITELERENERLRSIVRKGRDAYSAYGILVTLPGHAMYSEAGAKLRSEWLRETDEYLREIDQAREKG